MNVVDSVELTVAWTLRGRKLRPEMQYPLLPAVCVTLAWTTPDEKSGSMVPLALMNA